MKRYFSGEEEQKRISTFDFIIGDIKGNQEMRDFFIIRQFILETLTPSEAAVFKMRLGLDNAKPKSLAEIGEILGLPRERIRQMEAKAHRKLTHPRRVKLLKDLTDADVGYNPTSGNNSEDVSSDKYSFENLEKIRDQKLEAITKEDSIL